MDVVGFGGSSVDYVHVLPAAPEVRGPRSKVRISSHFVSCGGQVATALAACSALGLRTRFLGPIGSDANGSRVRDELARRGVDVSHVIVRQADNQFAVILVDDRTGERMVLWDRDPRMAMRELVVNDSMLASARVVHVDDVDVVASIALATFARERGAIVTSDIDGATDRTLDLIRNVTIPILAEEVPRAMTGIADPEGALRALRRHHPGLLCVTLGAGGAMALDGDRVVHAPAFAVDAVDTTGAGDVFRAGLIYGILVGFPVERMLRFANAAAAASCTRLGAIASVPELADVMDVLGESQG
ncbi:MAG: hypothetical protein A3H96_07870 [Acidobacteria bacterium RIFCSPLOWO2_02_FULL_67_36]|nr:MAG: hypothetical protein A3H96_07870 [Acidobacteria bacterium RIFCSPLOWO2_02_FULL_67_36]OFW20137.1 MAG: hypothetical protein A3G21_03835 [Acidobacteria bacterium RIFCSPLOWO2_12_FULL_66_21]